MQEHHLSVARTARYFTLGAAGAGTRELWLVCHGYGQLASRFLKPFAAIDDGARLIVAPEGLSRFYADSGRHERVGASWMTREDRLTEIDDYLRYLDAVHAAVARELGARASRLVVLGFSQGVATAARWVARGAAPAARLIAWAGELPPELDLTTLGRGRLTMVCGRTDPLITPKIFARDRARLDAAGVTYDVHVFDGEHELPDAELAAVAGG